MSKYIYIGLKKRKRGRRNRNVNYSAFHIRDCTRSLRLKITYHGFLEFFCKPIERIVWYKCQDKAWSIAPLGFVVMVRVVKQPTAVTLDVLPGKQANSNKL